MTRQPVVRTFIMAALVFIAAIAGVWVGRLIPDGPTHVSDLHQLLHDQLDLTADQDRELHLIEQRFAVRRQQLEDEMRAENLKIADAIVAEHRLGPQVSAAIDESHRTMGELQKETLTHIFAMRAILRADQAAKFDAIVTGALTDSVQ
jgi:hypothetical protein